MWDDVFGFASERLQNSRDFALKAVLWNYSAIKHLPEQLQRDREFMVEVQSQISRRFYITLFAETCPFGNGSVVTCRDFGGNELVTVAITDDTRFYSDVQREIKGKILSALSLGVPD